MGEECGEVTLYCRVTRGGLGVEGARVEATVEVLTPEGGLVRVVLQLQDDGWGEPDLEEGDGVYSGVMTEYPSVGRYSVLLRVVEEGEDREVLGPTLHMETLPSPCPLPSGVRDLSVSSYNSSLSAAWSSPQGVASYSLLYSTTLAGLLQVSAPSLLELEVQQGQAEEVRVEDITSPLYNQLYYVGLVARDLSGHCGRISNIETVWVPLVKESTVFSLPILGCPPQTRPTTGS